MYTFEEIKRKFIFIQIIILLVHKYDFQVYLERILLLLLQYFDSTIYFIGLDKRGYRVNKFLISRRKHVVVTN